MSCRFSASWTSLGFLSVSSLLLWSSLLSLSIDFFEMETPASISSANSWCFALSELELTAEYYSIMAWILLIFILLSRKMITAKTMAQTMAIVAPINGYVLISPTFQ